MNFSNDFLHDGETAVATLSRRIRRLAPTNQATLKVLCEHLSRVVAHESVNKMSASNLGLLFAPVVFGEDEQVTLESVKKHDLVMEILINKHEILFQNIAVEPNPSHVDSRSRATSAASSHPGTNLARTQSNTATNYNSNARSSSDQSDMSRDPSLDTLNVMNPSSNVFEELTPRLNQMG